MRLICFILLILLMSSCKQNTPNSNMLFSDYFSYNDSVEAGGVKMIPIKTPVGEFKVWTKRFGSNPKIKILLFLRI